MNKNYLIIGLIILALIVIGVIAAQPNGGEVPENGTEVGEENGTNGDEVQEPSISVDDQELSASSEILIAEVAAEEDGFIVIHNTNEDGEPVVPESIGAAPVSAGVNEGVAVALDEEITADTILVAMLHSDTDENGIYEYGADNTEVDNPVTLNGEVVSEPFSVTVPVEEEPTDEDGETDVEAEAGAEVDTTTETETE